MIGPTLADLRQEGIDLVGLPCRPIPCSGQIPQRMRMRYSPCTTTRGCQCSKYKGFGNSVNITLGLPFIRTSVDHGTTCTGSGRQGPGRLRSLITAINHAIQMVEKKI